MGTLEMGLRLINESGIGDRGIAGLRVLVLDNPDVLRLMKLPANKDLLVEGTAKIYADLFTDEEMEIILAFNKSATGQKLMCLTMQIAEASGQNARNWLMHLVDQADKEEEKKDEEDIALGNHSPGDN